MKFGSQEFFHRTRKNHAGFIFARGRARVMPMSHAYPDGEGTHTRAMAFLGAIRRCLGDPSVE